GTNWQQQVERYWYEGIFGGMGRNACVPNYGFPMAQVSAPADSISFADAWVYNPPHYQPTTCEGMGYYLVWYTPSRVADPLCHGMQAGAPNHGQMAIWHSGGGNATYFDGHAKWIRREAALTPPAQYQDLSNRRGWKLWY